LANKYHDENGRFCSRDEMGKAVNRLALAGNTSGYLELNSELQAIIRSEENSNGLEELINASADTELTRSLNQSTVGTNVDVKMAKKLIKVMKPLTDEDGTNDPLGNDLMTSYERLCSQFKVNPNWIKYAKKQRSISSKMGFISESYIQFYVEDHVEDKNSRIAEYFRGKEIEMDIKKSRKIVNKNKKALKAEIERMIVKYHVSEDYAKNILTSTESVSIPDCVALIKQDDGSFVLRTAEAKLGGKLDAKNLPMNIEKLHTSNEQIWAKSGFAVEKSIILLTTEDKKQSDPSYREGTERFPNKSAWVNSLNSNGGRDVQVHANEFSLNWLTGIDQDRDTEDENMKKAIAFRETLAFVHARDMFNTFHPNKLK
jgi:hypothetical protein